MKKYNLFIGGVLLLTFVSETCLFSQQANENSEQWDRKTIREADIWQSLLVNYYYADRTFEWSSRRQSLLRVIEQFPESQWADDAALMLVCDQVVIENDMDGGISELRNIIAEYPTATTILSGWDSKSGCRINNTWLKWAPSLVSQNMDSAISRTFPFDRDRRISILEREALVYFEHLDKHPNLTKDVAQFIIALMLIANGDNSEAIVELESLLESTQFSSLRAIDYEATNKPDGYLLECEPPQEIVPIWRVQYASCILLIELYQSENEKDKALQLALDLASACSPDGWYWNINQYVGRICSENDEFDLAIEQYEIALDGIEKIIDTQADRMETLYEQRHLVKHPNFISWQEEARKPHIATIKEIESRLHTETRMQ